MKQRIQTKKQVNINFIANFPWYNREWLLGVKYDNCGTNNFVKQIYEIYDSFGLNKF